MNRHAWIILIAVVLFLLLLWKTRVRHSTGEIVSVLSKWWPEIQSAASSFNVDPETVAAMVVQESSGNPEAMGTSGERGLMQVTPGALADVNLAFHYSFSPADLSTPLNGLIAGCAYYRMMLNRFPTEHEALAAYNAGAGNVKVGYPYAESVLAIKQEIHSLNMKGA